MKMTTKFTVSLQILCILGLYPECRITSRFISDKTGAEPSAIRYAMLDLKQKGYITSKPGPGGTVLATTLDKISLYDIYELMCDVDEPVLNFYDLPPDSDSLDVATFTALNEQFNLYKAKMLEDMKSVSIADICNRVVSSFAPKQENGNNL